MRIAAPAQFMHAGQLDDANATKDPRLPSFAEAEVQVDLRACDFIQPPALLWCVMYPVLAQRRSRVSVQLPTNAGVRQWIRSLGYPAILEHAGVHVDPPETGTHADAQVVLPLTRFATTVDAELVISDIVDSLSESRLGALNVRPLVGELFSELALNAVQHAVSPVGAYGYVQYYESETTGARFMCGVADGGIGIKEALRHNPELRPRTDAHAIDLALEMRISGTGEPNRGIGLSWVRDTIGVGKRRLAIHSILGAVLIEGPSQPRARFERLFPGTAACLWIPT